MRKIWTIRSMASALSLYTLNGQVVFCCALFKVLLGLFWASHRLFSFVSPRTTSPSCRSTALSSLGKWKKMPPENSCFFRKSKSSLVSTNARFKSDQTRVAPGKSIVCLLLRKYEIEKYSQPSQATTPKTRKIKDRKNRSSPVYVPETLSNRKRKKADSRWLIPRLCTAVGEPV